MGSEYYVTLLSSDSINFYENSLSSFTNQLNPPLELHPLGKWRVGILEIFHSFILNNPFNSAEDHIKFDENIKHHGSFNMEKLIFYTVMFAKQRELYTPSYFHSFLDEENLKDILTNEVFSDCAQKNFEVKNGETTLEIHLEFENEDVTPENFLLFTSKIDLSKIYTMKDILYAILLGYNTAFEETYKNHQNIREKRARKLKGYVDFFVDRIQHYSKRLLKKSSNNYNSNFMILYTDIISPRNFGEQYLNVLQMIPLREAASENTPIKNIQYFTVNSTCLSNISIKIVDENGNPTAFENSYSPTVVTLHFRKEL